MFAAKDAERQVAVLVVVAAEKVAELPAVQLNVGRIYVENEARRAAAFPSDSLVCVIAHRHQPIPVAARTLRCVIRAETEQFVPWERRAMSRRVRLLSGMRIAQHQIKTG